MFYCENCGNKLPSDARFCENCGHVVTIENEQYSEATSTTENFSLFANLSDTGWASKWRDLVYSGKHKSCGIILLNTKDCPDKYKQNFFTVLKQYIGYKAKEGVGYYVVDLAGQFPKKELFKKEKTSIEIGVNILREIYKAAPIKYLMIIGDRNCVGSIKWHNSVERDHDEYVDSDLPYASLDLTSPFEGGSRVIQISVGRIPSSAKNGFAEAISYLNNAMSYDSRGV